jgi:hypothetical protein
MRYHTQRYDIAKCGEDFNDNIAYEINLKDGYVFDDGTKLNYAESVEDLRELISTIEVER